MFETLPGASNQPEKGADKGGLDFLEEFSQQSDNTPTKKLPVNPAELADSNDEPSPLINFEELN